MGKEIRNMRGDRKREKSCEREAWERDRCLAKRERERYVSKDER